MKNYYTLYQTANDSLNKDSKFNSYFYPYGDYYQYTDNTLVVSGLVKILPSDFLKKHVIQVFHTYLFLMFFFSSVLLYKLFMRFKIDTFLAIFTSFLLVYICPQFFRLTIGHMNLSISFFLIFSIWVFTKHAYFKDKLNIKNFIVYLIVFLFASLTHLYHVAICIYLLLILQLTKVVYEFLKTRNVKSVIKTVKQSTYILPSLLAFSIISVWFGLIDSYSSDRIPKGDGFNWSFWNMPIESLFTSTNDHLISIFKFSNIPQNTDQYAFMGNFALIFLLITLPYFLYCKIFKKDFLLINSTNKKIIVWFFFGGIFIYFTALGVDAFGFNEKVHFKNYLNPFYYLRMISESFTQMRVMARFSWPLFWLINISFILMLNDFVKKSRFRTFVYVTFILLFVVDFISIVVIHPWSNNKQYNPIYHASDFASELQGITFSEYQAILPIPIYTSGVSSKDYTIDPEDNWCTKTFIYNIYSDLPLISYKADRSSETNTENLMSLVTVNPSDEIMKLLKESDKPLLVIRSKLDRSYQYTYNKEPGKAVYTSIVDVQMKDFIKRNKKSLELLKETDKVEIYRWEIK